MQFCQKCNVSISEYNTRCPLCQHQLNNENEKLPPIFPYIPTMYNKNSLFIRIVILAFITISVICVFLDLLIPTDIHWSGFVIAGIICVCISLAVCIRKLNNIPKIILHQVVIGGVFVILWDWFTGWHNWSLNYVIPFLCVGANISLGITSKLLKLRIDDIMLYFLMNILFGVIPILSIALGKVTVMYPSLISIALSVLAFSVLLLFKGESIREELKSRLHL